MCTRQWFFQTINALSGSFSLKKLLSSLNTPVWTERQQPHFYWQINLFISEAVNWIAKTWVDGFPSLAVPVWLSAIFLRSERNFPPGHIWSWIVYSVAISPLASFLDDSYLNYMEWCTLQAAGLQHTFLLYMARSPCSYVTANHG